MKRREKNHLVRHGQVGGHERHPERGHTDVAITEVGRPQTERLAERLRLTGMGTVYPCKLEKAVLGAASSIIFQIQPRPDASEGSR